MCKAELQEWPHVRRIRRFLWVNQIPGDALLRDFIGGYGVAGRIIYNSTRVEMLPEFLTAVTGHTYTLDDLLLVGERIANIRQAFTGREGYTITTPIPGRVYGIPPLEDGPTAGITVDIETLRREYLDEMGWTQDAAVPTREKLIPLGLDDVARDPWRVKGGAGR